MKPDGIKKTFCTTREAAVLLGVSVGTVQLWVETGVLEAWKTIGGHRRVMRDSVDRLLHKNTDHTLTPQQTDGAQAVLRPLSILVVDDDVNLLRLYEANMTRWPMAPTVMTANSAITGLLMIGSKCPDFLVTDLHMPDMDGFYMLRVLNSTPELANTTVTVVTGLDHEEIAHHGGLPAGIEVLPKPIPFDRLRAIATDIVNRGHFQVPPVNRGTPQTPSAL
jgi:excisionase family DNA binding protein